MAIFLELYLSIIRILLLFFGVIGTYFIGNTTYISINSFLYSITSPCLQLISFLVVFTMPLSVFYGIHIRKYFWQRSKKYNQLLLLISFVLGLLFTLTSTNTSFISSAVYCHSQVNLIGKIGQFIGTSLVIVLFVYIGTDIGVSLKHFSKKVQNNKKLGKKRK